MSAFSFELNFSLHERFLNREKCGLAKGTIKVGPKKYIYIYISYFVRMWVLVNVTKSPAMKSWPHFRGNAVSIVSKFHESWRDTRHRTKNEKRNVC